jgi:hypothetical protein
MLNLQPAAGGAAEEDADEIGRKVSAMFLAQVEDKNEDAEAKEARKKDDQKKSFLNRMRAKLDPKDKEESGTPKQDRLFERSKEVGQQRTSSYQL